ncbi:hypothetical protein O9G_003533 [Rozella allomycis CSF55]|uniref:Uncharacterized protein n=1 Tax=Rozella allomycis (strain CSF55) TaxID=988480 RepID=A0A075B036_ROZAC|nr:hypothetical protein O9G_003533 [Rozella allomycis CSF55]|eukprot:EPZ35888.1 hypothetical protein O9G_003533 [Rozella allomycis CSF55]
MRLRETFVKFPDSPCIQRTEETFSALGIRIEYKKLDDIIGYSGALKSVLTIIRDELYRSVYSNLFTTTNYNQSKFQRIPHYVVSARANQQEQEALRHEQENIKMKNLILDLEEKLDKKIYENEHFNKEKSSKENQYQFEINQLKEARSAVEKLSVFKPNGDFVDTKDNGNKRIIKAIDKFIYEDKTLSINALDLTEFDLKETFKMNHQIGELLNTQLDEYEQELNVISQKKSILDEMTSIEMNANSFQREKIRELRDEQELLVSHQKYLLKMKERIIQDADHTTVMRKTDEALKKYSIKIYVSTDNATSFRSLKSDFCKKCNDRISMCPHIVYHDKIVALPDKATHLKFIQPPLKIKDVRVIKESEIYELKRHPDIPEDDSEMRIVWNEFLERGGFKPLAVREIALSSALDKIEELLSARWKEDLLHDKSDNDFGMIPFRRYIQEEIALSVIHDLLLVFQKEEFQNSEIYSFLRFFAGTDEVSWKYVRLISNYLSKYNVDDSRKLKDFLSIVYPGRLKEDYDQMELMLLSSSKGRIDDNQQRFQLCICNFINQFSKFTFRLKKYDFANQGCLSIKMFDEYLNNIIPFSTTRMKRRFYKQAQIESDCDKLSIEELASK